MDELEEAIARVIAGPEKKSRRISEKEKEVIAYHEVGHALVMKALPLCNPVHKVSIISRGMALGWTLSLPEEDKYLVSKEELKQEISGIMGGRAAEEIVFGDVTSGAENDIQRATQMARRMVTQWGMSEKLGTVMMGHKEELVFLGRDLGVDDLAGLLLLRSGEPGGLGKCTSPAEDDVALLVLRLEDVDLDDVARRQLEVGVAAEAELLAGDDPFRLGADVHQHLVGVDPHDHTIDDVAVLGRAERLLIGEKEVLHGHRRELLLLGHDRARFIGQTDWAPLEVLVSWSSRRRRQNDAT